MYTKHVYEYDIKHEHICKLGTDFLCPCIPYKNYSPGHCFLITQGKEWLRRRGDSMRRGQIVMKWRDKEKNNEK